MATPDVQQKRYVIYTAISSGYDTLTPPRCELPSCDLVCFTDDPTLRSDRWDVRCVNSSGVDKAAWNRRFKMLPHEYFPEHQFSAYVDGNIQIVRDPCPLFDAVMAMGKIAVPPHPDRDCVFDELDACVERGLIDRSERKRRKAAYEAAGFPRHYGLFENNLIVRAHHDPEIVRLMQSWWDAYLHDSRRDQFSLVFLAWQQGVSISPIPDAPRTSRKYFRIDVHEPDRQRGYISRTARYIRANRHTSPLYKTLDKFVDLALKLRRT